MNNDPRGFKTPREDPGFYRYGQPTPKDLKKKGSTKALTGTANPSEATAKEDKRAKSLEYALTRAQLAPDRSSAVPSRQDNDESMNDDDGVEEQPAPEVRTSSKQGGGRKRTDVAVTGHEAAAPKRRKAAVAAA